MNEPTKIFFDSLMNLGYEFARKRLLEQKPLPPTWVLLLEDGPPKVLSTPWQSNKEKVLAAALVKWQMLTEKTVAYCFLSECWVAKCTREEVEKGDLVEPRNNPDRYEIVMVIACTAEDSQMKSWKIQRNPAGEVIGLARNLGSDQIEEFDGWIANLLKN